MLSKWENMEKNRLREKNHYGLAESGKLNRATSHSGEQNWDQQANAKKRIVGVGL